MYSIYIHILQSIVDWFNISDLRITVLVKIVLASKCLKALWFVLVQNSGFYEWRSPGKRERQIKRGRKREEETQKDSEKYISL